MRQAEVRKTLSDLVHNEAMIAACEKFMRGHSTLQNFPTTIEQDRLGELKEQLEKERAMLHLKLMGGGN